MEEDLGAQEALVAHVDGELLLADGVDAGVLLDPLGAVRVVLVELLDQVGAHVAEALLEAEEGEGWKEQELTSICRSGEKKAVKKSPAVLHMWSNTAIW